MALTKYITEVMMKGMKSKKIEQQCNWIGDDHPHGLEDSRRYIIEIWSKRKNEEMVIAIKNLNEELQQHMSGNIKDQQRTKMDMEIGEIRDYMISPSNDNLFHP